jgi:fructokinase
MRIGIDLGGTKIEGVVLDPSGRERARRRVPTPRDGYAAILQAIRDLVATLEAELGARGSIGVGIPGTISPATGLVKNANSTTLIGHPLDVDLARLLGRPVRVANDANCFALSEASDGAAAPGPDEPPLARPRVVFGVILGTGVGGGVVIDGRVLVGGHGIAGEWGHNPLPWPGAAELPGPACYCGRAGCLETFLAGPSLARDHEAVTGERCGAAEIAARAATGEPAADATLARYEDRLARGLATIINVLDPDVIVLGGGVSNVERLYTAVPARWDRYVFSDVVRVRLVRALHGDSSGVRGAAWLWPAELDGDVGAGGA